MDNIPKWLIPVWQQVQLARQQQRLPHALLLTGPAGVGKGLLADALSASLLCQQPQVETGQACGQCQSCRLLAGGTHPDALSIEPEEAGKAIKVDQIRQLSRDLAMTSHAGGYKIARISPAEAMNINAANSLLKTLEEPTDNTLILLVSVTPGRLPVTLRSRCQMLRCPLPARQDAADWLLARPGSRSQVDSLLELANGAPFKALELAGTEALEKHQACMQQLVELASGQQDPVAAAAAGWEKDSGVEKLQWFLAAVQDLIRTLQTGQTGQNRLAQALQDKVRGVDNRRLFALMDEIGDGIRQWSSGLNTQLIVEALLIRWSGIFAGRARPAAG